MTADFSHLAASGMLDNRGPMLIAGASEQARDRATRTIEDAGWRTSAFPIQGAVDRLTRQGAASGLWIELGVEDAENPKRRNSLDRLLSFANHEAGTGRLPAIVAAPASLIDLIAAQLDADGTQLLIDPQPIDRATALLLVAAEKSDPVLHDVAREPASRRLKQLSDEVGRIAATLARLSTGPDVSSKSVERPGIKGDIPPVSGEAVRNVIRARRLRARYFDELLFADPAWDMLLDLLAAEIAQHRVPVSSLCIAAAVPATTALRWIKTMTDEKLFVRRADPHDGRRVFIELAPDTSAAMHRYFAEVGAVAAA